MGRTAGTGKRSNANLSNTFCPEKNARLAAFTGYDRTNFLAAGADATTDAGADGRITNRRRWQIFRMDYLIPQLHCQEKAGGRR